MSMMVGLHITERPDAAHWTRTHYDDWTQVALYENTLRGLWAITSSGIIMLIKKNGTMALDEYLNMKSHVRHWRMSKGWGSR